jgi:hypothetical protein
MYKSKFVILCSVISMGLTLLLAGGCQQSAENASAAKSAATPVLRQDERSVVPVSTQFLVTLNEAVETNKNNVGDIIGGQLAKSIDVAGKVVIPEGSNVNMVITQLVKGGTMKTRPEIAFTIKDITLADGKTYTIESSQIYEKGRSHTGREVGMIGGGAAAGAVVGALIGKGKGAIIGAAAGAAAGTGASALTGRQNLVYSPGEMLTFTSTQPITVTMRR